MPARRWRGYEDSNAIVDALEQGLAAADALAPDGIVFNFSIGAWAGSHHPKAAFNRALCRLAGRNGDNGRLLSSSLAPAMRAAKEAITGRVSRLARRPARRHRRSSKSGRMGRCASGAGPWRPQATGRRVRSRSTGPGGRSLQFGDGVLAVGEVEGGIHGTLSCARVVIARADHAWQAAAFSVEITAAPCGAALAEVHAWVERDCDGCGSHLAPSHRASTLTSLACAPGIAGLDTADQASRRR